MIPCMSGQFSFSQSRKQGAELLCCSLHGCKGRVRNSKRTPSLHLLQGSSVAFLLSKVTSWVCVLLQMCRVNFSHPREQGAECLCCASHVCQGRVRSSKRIPSWHLLQGSHAALSQNVVFWLCMSAKAFGQFFTTESREQNFYDVRHMSARAG